MGNENCNCFKASFRGWGFCGQVVNYISHTFTFQGHFSVFRCTCLKLPVHQKWIVVEQKGNQIWDSERIVSHMGYIGVVLFSIIFGSFIQGTCAIIPCNLKMAGDRGEESK